jgi:HEAT repeat protein
MRIGVVALILLALAALVVVGSKAHRKGPGVIAQQTASEEGKPWEGAAKRGAPPGGSLAAQAAAEPRKAAAAGATDDMARERAFQSAAQVGSADAIAWLADMAATDEPSATRAAAALGSVANKDAADQLEQLARSDARPLVRANAIHALARSGGPDNAAYLSQVVTDTRQVLRLRQEAALTLAAIGDASVAPALAAALGAATHDRGGDSEQLRISIVQALGAIGSPEALASLKQYATGTLSKDERAFVAKYVPGDALAR